MNINYLYDSYYSKVRCRICGKKSVYISETLGLCNDCIRRFPKKTRDFIIAAHMKSRSHFNLPATQPCDEKGTICGLCINNCRIVVNKKGYCGIRKNIDGKIHFIFKPRDILPAKKAVVEWYHDPLPTNCVADWVCPGCSDCGYPEYSYTPEAEHGYKNLAVFFGACSLDCLFCQNWHFREMAETLNPVRDTEELIDSIDNFTSCICFFGGDPSVQMEFALEASRKALENKKNKTLRICWETNGTMKVGNLIGAVEISLETGGCIKFDLKAYGSNLFFALTGGSNKNTLDNFIKAAGYIEKRPSPPLLIASTLLIPGYIDEAEIRKIAKFIKELNPNIPYKLLGFHPQFYMCDIPPTPKKLAYACLETAKIAGLKNVDIGNRHLLI